MSFGQKKEWEQLSPIHELNNVFTTYQTTKDCSSELFDQLHTQWYKLIFTFISLDRIPAPERFPILALFNRTYLSRIAKMLNKQGLWSASNLNIVMKCHLPDVEYILEQLSKQDLLSKIFGQNYFDQLITPDSLNTNRSTIEFLSKFEEAQHYHSNLGKFIQSRNKPAFAKLIQSIHAQGLLSQELIKSLFSFNDNKLNILADFITIITMEDNQLLTQDNLKMLLSYVEYWSSRSLTDENNPHDFLKTLQQQRLFSGHFADKNLKTFLNYFNLASQKDLIYRINDKNSLIGEILNQDGFNNDNTQLKFDIIMTQIPKKQCSAKEIMQAILFLEKLGLLIGYHTTVIEHDHPFLLVRALARLHDANYLEQFTVENLYKNLTKSKCPEHFVEAYLSLQQEGLSSTTTTPSLPIKFTEIKSLFDPLIALHTLRYLWQHELLTTEIRQVFQKHADIFCQAISCLLQQDQTIVPIEVFKSDVSQLLLHIQHPLLPQIAEALVKLNQTLRTHPHFKSSVLEMVLAHPDPVDFTSAMIRLNELALDQQLFSHYQNLLRQQGVSYIHLSSDPKTLPPDQLRLLTQQRSIFALHKNTIFFISPTPDIKITDINGTKTDYKKCVTLFPTNKDILYPVPMDFIEKIKTLMIELKCPHYCVNIADCIAILHQNHLLTPEFRIELLLNHNNLIDIAKILATLKENKLIIDDKLILALSSHKNAVELGKALLLIKDFSLNFFTFLVRNDNPYQLAEAFIFLKDTNLLLSKEIFTTPVRNTLIKHRWPLSYAKFIKMLYDENLLKMVLTNDAHLQNELFLTNPETYAKIIILFHRHNLLKSKIHQENASFTSYFLNFIKKSEVDKRLCLLQTIETCFCSKNHLTITGELIKAITVCSEPDNITTLVSNLSVIVNKLANKPLERILIRLIRCGRPQQLLPLFQTLQEKGLFTIKNVSIALYSFEEVQILLEQNLITQPYLNSIINTELNKSSAIRQWDSLRRQSYNTVLIPYLETILTMPEPNLFLAPVETLIKAHLCTKENLETLVQQPKLQQHTPDLLRLLHNARFLNQHVFNKIVSLINVLSYPQISQLWLTIPGAVLTEAHVSQLLDICANGRLLQMLNPDDDAPTIQNLVTKLQTYIQRQILQIPEEVEDEEEEVAEETTTLLPSLGPVVLNEDNQTTHTASVHKSVSDSAERLWKHYGPQIDLDKQKLFLQIRTQLSLLPMTTDMKIAQQSWNYLIRPAFCLFRDPQSQRSVAELIAVFWLAIRDFETRIHHESDDRDTLIAEGEALFVQMLIELYRDGNIDENGVDDQQPTRKPACPSGTINKIIEKLVGIHPDVKLEIITTAGATLKFQFLVRQEIIIAAQQLLLHSDAPADIDLDVLLHDVYQATWPTIKETITNQLFDEFSAAFAGNREHPYFIALIELGPDVELEPEQLQRLEQFKQALHTTATGTKRTHEEQSDDSPQPKRLASPRAVQRFFAERPVENTDAQLETEETAQPDDPSL